MRFILLTWVVIFYIYHPTITNVLADLLICQKLMDGRYFLKTNYDIECYTSDHKHWLLTYGLSTVVVIVIGYPLMLVAVLCKNRKRLNEEDIRVKYGFIYEGLKP